MLKLVYIVGNIECELVLVLGILFLCLYWFEGCLIQFFFDILKWIFSVMYIFFFFEDQLNVQVFKIDNKDNFLKLNYKFDIY